MGRLGGKECDVLHDFKLINREAAALGLQLNHHKSELIFEELAGTDILNAAPDLCKVSRENATLLGSPIGLSHSVNVAITDKVNALKTMGSRLCHLSKPPGSPASHLSGIPPAQTPMLHPMLSGQLERRGQSQSWRR